jgi:hypothetical protein
MLGVKIKPTLEACLRGDEFKQSLDFVTPARGGVVGCQPA